MILGWLKGSYLSSNLTRDDRCKLASLLILSYECTVPEKALRRTFGILGYKLNWLDVSIIFLSVSFRKYSEKWGWSFFYTKCTPALFHDFLLKCKKCKVPADMLPQYVFYNVLRLVLLLIKLTSLVTSSLSLRQMVPLETWRKKSLWLKMSTGSTIKFARVFKSTLVEFDHFFLPLLKP